MQRKLAIPLLFLRKTKKSTNLVDFFWDTITAIYRNANHAIGSRRLASNLSVERNLMPRIHCLNNISKKGTDKLPGNYSLVDTLEEADGVLVRSMKLHDTQFPKDLLAIARAGAGVNNIPLDRCADEGIVVFNTPGANANAVKELIICSMLLGSRGIIAGNQWIRDNAADPDIAKTVEKAKKQFAGREIAGKKLGVIGLGAIGALVANVAEKLGMDVYGYDPYVSVNAAWRISGTVHHVTNLDDICANCDYITIHVPTLESTIGMIDAHQIEIMKPDAVLMNFSRDTLVDQDALADALNNDTLGCYITDFVTPQALAAKNCIIMPHIGASTAEAEENCAVMAVDEIVDYIENGNIRNSVNFPACDMGPAPAEGSRVGVLHKNLPGMINTITASITEEGVNLANITSKARGDYAYALIDLDAALTDAAIERIAGAEGILRVRVVK